MRDVSCPVCHADIPFSGEEEAGDEVYCAYCSAPLVVKGRTDDEYELEED